MIKIAECELGFELKFSSCRDSIDDISVLYISLTLICEFDVMSKTVDGSIQTRYKSVKIEKIASNFDELTSL